ncbi:glycosyltransferase family 4 protein [Rhodospira trueperi]|uniref:Glycosyltransferase involved in cell wall bisynthesis n=1 Tax=Rhodospira trueperi TaxID=69960 RepID=A0A1G7BSI9_9PROT|nr:glycosyltransferase family 4 protein [Rhodospira trueperi]SDE29912.1 Glycosyltransferase involved in cell wall bisynthesis [Rhodospira trueperi]
MTRSGEIPRQADRARVCLVTTEILGVTRTGGIGTVMTALADLLVGEGHDVTVLCLNGRRVMDGDFDGWARHYRNRGVTLEPLPPVGADAVTPPMAGVWARGTLARRWHVLRWLDGRAFDLVHFNDWGGEAALCGQARALGVALRRTRLVLGLHGASDWTMAGNAAGFAELERLVQMDLERVALSVMDAVWAPGRFMPDWLAGRGVALPPVRIMPQLMPGPGPSRPFDGDGPIEDLVLFGRLEDRKGVAVFLDALDLLAARGGAGPRRVTFLGRAGTVEGEPAGRVIARRAREWPWSVAVLDTLDRAGALEYLRGAGRLALVLAPMENCPLTLHECLALRVPVLASDTGGIPALIAEGDRARVLVPHEAMALADRLGAVLGRPFAAARPAFDPDTAAARWRGWHRDLLARPADPPSTSIGSRAEGATIVRLTAPDGRPCPVWKHLLEASDPEEGAVCLLTDADELRSDALSDLAAVMARTGADVLAPGWREGGNGGGGRARLCLDGAPASACVVNVVAGPGLVLGPRARAVAARDWDPASGLWGLVAHCEAAGLVCRAVPLVAVERAPPWRDPGTARALAPRLWAGLARADRAELIALFASGLSARCDSDGGMGVGAAARRVARRDRRRARVLWRSWPWRWTRPLRNITRARHGLAPEPPEPPLLTASGDASAVLYGMLVSTSWALMAGPRLVVTMARGARRRLFGCVRRPRVDS